MTKATILPNGCRVSKFTVNPKNWKSKAASVRQTWYCRYRFYDTSGKVYQGYISGVNHLPTAEQRRQLLQAYIDQELNYLTAGFNPLTKEFAQAVSAPSYRTWEDAVKSVIRNLKLADTTRRDLEFRVNLVLRKASEIGFSGIAVQDVKKIHIKQLLRECFPESAYGYNKGRAYLMMIYKELAENDLLEHNIIRDISKQKVTKKLRETLTEEQRILVDRHLKANHYEFWRYLHIFFHSGARSTEMLQLRRQDIDLPGQRFKTMVKKGSCNREVWRTIKDVALPFWEELLSKPGDIIFSYRLSPGDKHIRFDTVTKYWWVYVKRELGITADFYSLKHLATTQTVDALGDLAAAAHNAHTSTAMVVGIYDQGRAAREHEKIKKLQNKFV